MPRKWLVTVPRLEVERTDRSTGTCDYRDDAVDLGRPVSLLEKAREHPRESTRSDKKTSVHSAHKNSSSVEDILDVVYSTGERSKTEPCTESSEKPLW